MMRRGVTMIAAGAVGLSGCAAGLPGARPLTYVVPGEARIYATGQACVHEPSGKELGGLVAAVLTGAASQILKNFGTALSEGAKGGQLTPSVATANLQLRPGTAPRCVVVVRGLFQPDAKHPSPVDMPSFLGLATADEEGRRRLTALQLPPIYAVDHYLELRLDSSNDAKALTFAPVFVSLQRSTEGATKGVRDLSASLKFNRVGVEAAGSAVVVADIRVGSSRTFVPEANGRFTIEAPWFGSFHAAPSPTGTAKKTTPATVPVDPARAPSAEPAPSGPVGAGGGGVGVAGADAVIPAGRAPGPAIVDMQSSASDAVPITMVGTVVLTRPTNEALAFAATLFNGVEPKVEDTIKPILDPASARAAATASLTDSLDAQAEYATAQGAAEAAIIGYCGASSAADDAAGKQDRVGKSKDARAAQLKANVAAIKAATDPPYASLIVVSSKAPIEANAGQCAGR